MPRRGNSGPQILRQLLAAQLRELPQGKAFAGHNRPDLADPGIFAAVGQFKRAADKIDIGHGTRIIGPCHLSQDLLRTALMRAGQSGFAAPQPISVPVSAGRHNDADDQAQRHHQPKRNSESGEQEIADAFVKLRIEHGFLHLAGRPDASGGSSLSCLSGERGKVFASEVKRLRQAIRNW